MDFYISEDYSNLENLPLVNELFIHLCFLGDLLKLHIFTRAFIFTTDEEKEMKNQFFNYFWRMLLKFDDKLIWLSITWILKKLSSIQTLVEHIPEITLSHWYLLSKTYKKSHYKNRTLIVLKKFVRFPNNHLLFLFGFGVIESQL